MGCWCSKKAKDQRVVTEPESPSNESQTPAASTNNRKDHQPTVYPRTFSGQYGRKEVPAGFVATERRVIPPSKVVINRSFLNVQNHPFFHPSTVVSFTPLSESDFDYHQIRRKVTNKHNFIIHSIERVENPYLKMAYELKKEQKLKEYPNLEEHLLFHGTKRQNYLNICKYNLNWRYCKTHKFGKGISFSPNSTYASNYSDENDHEKVMIVAKVLIGKSCFGRQNMILPEPGCDTSQKGEDGIVIVKYDDNEFYPVFIIDYHLKNPNVGRKQYGRQNNYYNNRRLNKSC